MLDVCGARVLASTTLGDLVHDLFHPADPVAPAALPAVPEMRHWDGARARGRERGAWFGSADSWVPASRAWKGHQSRERQPVAVPDGGRLSEYELHSSQRARPHDRF